MVQRKLTIDEGVRNVLLRAKYRVYLHSAVEVCHWTRKAIKNEGVCYKSVFYGIDTHRCMEFSPTAVYCENRCIYCWRPVEFYQMLRMPENMVAEPDEIIENLIKLRRELLVGYFGDEKADKMKLKEAMNPNHFAISLSGEPMMYPKLPEMVRYLRRREGTKSIFIVTNGQEPHMIEKLIEEDALPTQLYLSMTGFDERSYERISKPMYRDAWKRWLKSLKLLSQVKTRTVIRYTLIRGINDSLSDIEKVAELIEMGNPHFVEIKSYMHIGASLSRLTKEHMLRMDEIRSYSEALLKYLKSFTYMDEVRDSRVAVLRNENRYVERWIKSVEPSA